MTENRVAELSSGMGTQEILEVGAALVGPTNPRGRNEAGVDSNKKRGASRAVQRKLPSLRAPLPGLCCENIMGRWRYPHNGTKV